MSKRVKRKRLLSSVLLKPKNSIPIGQNLVTPDPTPQFENEDHYGTARAQILMKRQDLLFNHRKLQRELLKTTAIQLSSTLNNRTSRILSRHRKRDFNTLSRPTDEKPAFHRSLYDTIGSTST